MNPPTSAWPRPFRRRVLLGGGLGLTLAALLAHARVYRFLTDDAFISFRYAANLAAGHGLVYNPGFERVEGYTNFLWVVLLGGLERAFGLAPEAAANPLLVLCTVGLWALVAREALRGRDPGESVWPALVAPALLALTRSVAVWSTSGLETRLFELLVVAAALRLLAEVRALAGGGAGTAVDAAAGEDADRPPPPFPWSAPLFALATLTRPDGGLIAVAAMGAAAAWAAAQGHRRGAFRWTPLLRLWALQALLFGAPVLLHLLWRHGYYGEWLPNTWYAKVGDRTWWSMGGLYLATFAFEYGAPLWLLPLGLAVARHARRGTLAVPLVYAAVVLPHALYVARIGGDHFEYRPLNLYFPFVFLLLGDAAREAARGVGELRRSAASRPERARSAPLLAAAGGAWGGLLVLALVWLPWQSHRQYPERFIPGFPGVASGEPETLRYLEPSRDPLLRWPGLRAWAEAHRRRLYALTSRLGGVRAEEHRLFVERARPTALALRRLVERGVLPADTHIAVSAAGVVPYLSGLRTLDRLGLNDREVARSAPTEPRLVGHERHATLAYAALRGVDLWAEDPVHLLLEAGDPRLPVLLDDALRYRQDVHFALTDEGVLLARLPLGLEAARRRLPALELHSLLEDEPARLALQAWVAEGRRARLAADPDSPEARLERARELEAAGQGEAARQTLEPLAARGDARALAQLGTLHMRSGRYPEAARALAQAAELAPDLRGLQYNLGATLVQLGRWGEARVAFTRALRLEPGDPQLRYALGVACHVLDDRACTQEQLGALDAAGTETAAGWAAELRRALAGP